MRQVRLEPILPDAASHMNARSWGTRPESTRSRPFFQRRCHKAFSATRDTRRLVADTMVFAMDVHHAGDNFCEDCEALSSLQNIAIVGAPDVSFRL